MNDKKRSKQIAKFMRFFTAGVLAFAVITGFSFSALAAQPLDWEAYAHSDKYYVRIERRYPEDERYEEFSTGEYIQRGCIRYAAYDAETGKEVVSQDLWYRMDQAKMYEIIPYEAAFPDIHVDRYGERYEENDVNVPGEGDSSVVFFDPWPLADGGYSQSDATQNSCSWSIEIYMRYRWHILSDGKPVSEPAGEIL